MCLLSEAHLGAEIYPDVDTIRGYRTVPISSIASSREKEEKLRFEEIHAKAIPSGAQVTSALNVEEPYDK